MDKSRFKINPVLWGVPLVLSGIGILLIVSTTGPSSFSINGTPYQVGLKQLLWLCMAIIASVFMYNVPLKIWYRISPYMLICSWIMTWLPKVPGIGMAIGGARRWVHIPGVSVSLQPSELLCLSLALHLAKILSRRTQKADGVQFLEVVGLFLACALPVMMQPDMGTTMVMFVISMGMYVERKGWKFPLCGLLIGAVGFYGMILLQPYRMRRLAAWLDPWSDPFNNGYQTIQGLIAFANGGFWGSGLGHGFQKLNYLPAAYTDFIYAAISEEMGLIGALVLLMAVAYWLSQVNKVYFRCEEGYMASLTWGLALTVLFPLVINVGGVTKLIPLTGMPFPFLSYGGTSLLMMWSRIGVIMRLEKESEPDYDED